VENKQKRNSFVWRDISHLAGQEEGKIHDDLYQFMLISIFFPELFFACKVLFDFFCSSFLIGLLDTLSQP